MEPTIETVVDLFRSVHQQLRDTVRDMDSDQLNWSPASDANSVAVILTHTLASELDTLLLVRGLTGDRDRDAEFRTVAPGATNLLAAIDRADELLAQHGEYITVDELMAVRTRPNRDPQIGLHWLINNYGHAREHLGHLQLTTQMYQQATQG
jgi:hypothetical protein